MGRQNPNVGLVSDKVWSELAFAPELSGLTKDEVRLRVGETASYFGLRDLFDRHVETLSGGEKQLLSLAAAAAGDPVLLLLDEPTSMLDPIAAARFLDTLERMRRDLGVTVLLAEHRFSSLYPLADRVLALENGRVIADGTPGDAAKTLSASPLFGGFPPEIRLWSALGCPGKCPASIADGRALLTKTNLPAPTPTDGPTGSESLLSAENLTFYFEKNAPPAVTDVTLDVKAGRHLCILGGNGAGKTTLLRLLAGLLPPTAGKLRLFGKPYKAYKRGALYKEGVALLPQDPSALFLKSTVLEDLTDVLPGKKEGKETAARSAAEKAGLTGLLARHPLDLSGGECQRAALLKILLTKPRVLLLDEPTKGLDAEGKRALRETVRRLTDEGKAVVTVTHDVEFAAAAADECAFLFRGEILSRSAPADFFAKNRFYTPAVSRLAPGYLTVEALAAALREGGQTP